MQLQNILQHNVGEQMTVQKPLAEWLANLRHAVKFCLRILFSIAVLPFSIFYWSGSLVGGRTRSFQAVCQALSLIPSIFGVYCRAAFLSSTSKQVNPNVSIGFITLLSNPDITIGDSVYIGAQCNIGSCAIGDDCLIGSGVHVLSGKNQHHFHALDLPIRQQGGKLKKIIIGRNCWIGNHTTIMANIGDNSIVAAGSVVVDDLPEGCIAAGNPANVLKKR